jgi:polyprenyldihydroxybenzoate methyltransferase / 3-demethylubiquinol 3-O-methyltransferase
LQPGGSIFVTTINKTLISFVLAKLFGEYIFGLVPVGTHSWFKFVNHRTVEEILNQCNCTKHELRGWYYRVIQAEWEFCNWTNSAYALHMVKDSQ